jgi:hypothetical protein
VKDIYRQGLILFFSRNNIKNIGIIALSEYSLKERNLFLNSMTIIYCLNLVEIKETLINEISFAL